MNPNIYRQNDPRWGSLAYPRTPSTVATDGCGLCAVTHCAIEQSKYWKYTPKNFYSFMKKYAVFDNGTEWAGIDAGLDEYIGNHKRHYDMASFWSEMSKGNRVGVILFGKGTSPDGTIWTYGGHFVAVLSYKYENGQHWVYTKDSNGSRCLDGWRSYERSIKGCIPDVVWTAELMKDGWYKEDGSWYYYKGGVMLKNDWVLDNKKWYFLGVDGKMYADKWCKWKESWYWLKSNGAMATNEWVKGDKGWCYCGADGKMYSSRWLRWKNNMYYLKADGYMQTGSADILCKFDKNGKLVAE